MQVERDVTIKIRIWETEYSGEAARVWLLSELFGIHHKVTFVKPEL